MRDVVVFENGRSHHLCVSRLQENEKGYLKLYREANEDGEEDELVAVFKEWLFWRNMDSGVNPETDEVEYGFHSYHNGPAEGDKE